MDSPTPEDSFVEDTTAESGVGAAAQQDQRKSGQVFEPQKPHPIKPSDSASTPMSHPSSAFLHPSYAFLHPSSAFRQPTQEVFVHRPSSSASGTLPFTLPPATQMPFPHDTAALLGSNSAAIFPLLSKQQHQQSECCVVCSDRASGHHYGEQSCEGCKAFFRRSILSGQQYECAENNQCPIDRMSRRCQKCRLEKCLKMGMQRSLVRPEKNRKRKNDSEQSCTHQTVERVNDGIVKAFKSLFLVQVGENSSDKSAQLIPFANFAEARDLCQHFLKAIPGFSEANEEIILNNDKVTTILTVLSVLLNAGGDHHKSLGVEKEQLTRVRHHFSGMELQWEEVAVFMAVMMTFDDCSKLVDKLLGYGLFAKLSDRVAEDAEKVNAKTLELYTKLIINICQLC